MVIQDWYTVTLAALQSLWGGFLRFIPLLIGALIVFIIGWFISVWIGRLITEVLKRLNFNKLFEKENWRTAFERAEIKVDPSGFVGAIVKWILVIVFLLAAVEILGLPQFASLLKSVLGYLPNVVVAVFIFVVTVIVVDIVDKVLRTAVESMKVDYGNVVSGVVRWSIWIFAILMILDQLQIAKLFTGTLFTGLVYTLVLIFGLSFGLGGKDVAAEILQDIKKKWK